MPTLEELKNAKRVAWVTSFDPTTIHVASREQRNILLRREPDGLAVSESYLSELTTVRVLEEFPEPTVEERLEGADVVRFQTTKRTYVAVRHDDSSLWNLYEDFSGWRQETLAEQITCYGGHFSVLKER